MPNYSKIVERAVANIQKIFSNKRALGKDIGSIVGSLAIGGVTGYLTRGGRKIRLTETGSIYIDRNGTINSDGYGTVVAKIYDGDDGHSYKHTAVGWFVWDGYDWTAAS